MHSSLRKPCPPLVGMVCICQAHNDLQVTQATDYAELLSANPWLKTTRLVVKPDMLFGKRGKHDLVGLDLDFAGVEQFIKARMNKRARTRACFCAIGVSSGQRRCMPALLEHVTSVSAKPGLSGVFLAPSCAKALHSPQSHRHASNCRPRHTLSTCTAQDVACVSLCIPNHCAASSTLSVAADVCDIIAKGHPPPQVTVDGCSGPVNTFIVEPFVPHDAEYYLSVQSKRLGDDVSFSEAGGVEIEANWDRVQTVRVRLRAHWERAVVQGAADLYCCHAPTPSMAWICVVCCVVHHPLSSQSVPTSCDLVDGGWATSSRSLQGLNSRCSFTVYSALAGDHPDAGRGVGGGAGAAARRPAPGAAPQDGNLHPGRLRGERLKLLRQLNLP